MNYDFAVVGSGGAGLMAALSAAVNGARVVVVERSPLLGGTTAISGGGMWLPGNQFMQDQGFPESEGETARYLDRLTFGRTKTAVIEAFIDTAPSIVDFLQEHTAIELEGTDTPDYRTNLPGAATAGRQVATGLYDSKRLGELKGLLRASPMPGGMPPVRHRELQETQWGLGDDADQWVAATDERNAQGIVGRGRALVGAMLEACAKLGVSFITDTRAAALVEERGRIKGLIAEQGGQERRIDADAGVMLASGGFEWNRAMWDRFVSVPLDGPLSPPFNEGDGIRMACSVGAQLGNLHDVWWMPSVAIPGDVYEGRPRLRGAQQDKALPGAIVVNRSGRRFGNEAMSYNDFGKLMVMFDPHSYSYPNTPAYVVFDGRHLERYRPAKDVEDALSSGWLFEGSTLRTLADKIGVDGEGLEAQVEAFNRDAAQGVDRAFNRGAAGWEQYRADTRYTTLENRTLGPLEEAPYYAYKLSVGCFGTSGGVVTDENGQVTDFAHHPIPGLYAAGNVTAGVFSGAYPGGGATLGPAVVFGLLAGRAASKG